MRVSALGLSREVEAFERYWLSAADVIAGVAPPDSYVHHRFGEAGLLLGEVARAGWSDVAQSRIDTTVCVAPDSLWPWLWQALPIRREDGSYLEQLERVPHEDAVYQRLLERCAPQRDSNGNYQFRMAAWLVRATRGDNVSCDCLTTVPHETQHP